MGGALDTYAVEARGNVEASQTAVKPRAITAEHACFPKQVTGRVMPAISVLAGCRSGLPSDQ